MRTLADAVLRRLEFYERKQIKKKIIVQLTNANMAEFVRVMRSKMMQTYGVHCGCATQIEDYINTRLGPDTLRIRYAPQTSDQYPYLEFEQAEDEIVITDTVISYTDYHFHNNNSYKHHWIYWGLIFLALMV